MLSCPPCNFLSRFANVCVDFGISLATFSGRPHLTARDDQQEVTKMKVLNSPVLLFCLALTGATTAFAAEPTLHEVYIQVEAGHLGQAKSMMDEVLRSHPNSAKAHFVEAEILAKQGELDSARTELAAAERLDGSLSFAKPEAVRELNQRLTGHTGTRLVAPLAPEHAGSSGFDLRWAALLALLFVGVVYFLVRRRPAEQTAQFGGNAGNAAGGYFGGGGGLAPAGAPGGYGPGAYAPPPAPSGGLGSSLLGGLATGAAVGAGVVAGEMLMHKVLDGGHHADSLVPPASAAQPLDLPFEDPTYDAGGQDFGVTDSGSWDDGGGGGDWN
jgi:hypothetical protein